MTRTEIALIVVGIGVLIALLLVFSSGRPRVTEITRTIRKDEDSADA